MSLPLVNPFATPYENWSKRPATTEEMLEHLKTEGYVDPLARDRLLYRVESAAEAAHYMARIGFDNGLEFSIDRSLDSDPFFAAWMNSMPSPTPAALASYQEEYPHCDFAAADREIRAHGDVLTEGQLLFHAGLWQDDNVLSIATTRPFSTTFCPQVAIRNMDHRGKAYDAGRIDLFLLRVHQPRTPVFAFVTHGTPMGHEKEVLFAAGAEMTFRSRTLIRTDYEAHKLNCPVKLISTYVVKVDIT